MPGILDRVVALIEGAGAVSESDSERDGFASYKSEVHALGMGISAGWYFGATGETQLLSLVYGAAVYGRSYGESGQRRRVFADIKKEPHYALGGVVFGWVLGSVSSVSLSIPAF